LLSELVAWGGRDATRFQYQQAVYRRSSVLFDWLAEYLPDDGHENSIASKRNGEYARDI